eukprot:CAMPEP_0185744976 /NCGR_PEP_ID=MMETSP1174-20130828/3256_1 /TAXON_ID=35687 /ORGANISM="Dictyocha speculum, Strain CCMP1381" /LENGTH=253 /DNA_ID=CAMNT_0028418723 /DNA_START=24 /DNA_END=782 /DNA_ORIENTATION=+
MTTVKVACLVLLMAHANFAFVLSPGHRHTQRLILSSQRETVAQTRVKGDRRKRERMQRLVNAGQNVVARHSSPNFSSRPTELFARNAVVTHATGPMTSYLETATSSQELKVGDTVTWTAADEDVPEGTPGIVIALSTDDPGYFEVEFPEVILEVDGDALQRVEVPKAAVAPTASSQESRFKLGDTVTWTDTDTDVPAGTQGVVIGVSTVEPKIFEVEFPAVILEVSGNNLRPAAPPPPAVPVLPKPTPVERQK